MTQGGIFYLSGCTILPNEMVHTVDCREMVLWPALPPNVEVHRKAGAESRALRASPRLPPQPELQMGSGAQLGPSQGTGRVPGRALGDMLQNKGGPAPAAWAVHDHQGWARATRVPGGCCSLCHHFQVGKGSRQWAGS